MTQLSIPAFLVATVLFAPAVPAQDTPASKSPKTLTLEQASGRGEAPSFSARAGSFSWAPDGVHVVLGRGEGQKWLDPRTLEEREPPKEEKAADEEADDGKPTREEIAAALQAIEGIDEKTAERIARGGRASDDGMVRLFDEDEGLYFFGRDAAGEDRVGIVDAADGPFELLDVTADGRFAAWVANNDLRVLNTATGELLEVTNNGSEEFFNGKLDWVYQEELYGRGNFKAFWFSNDGEHVAFLALDESAVHEFTVVDHVEDGTFRVKPEVSNYPKAGDPNPTVKLGIASTADGSTEWVDLARYASAEPLVVRVGWTPDDLCLFMVQDRIQTMCDVNVIDPGSREMRTLIQETSDTWTERPSPPRWLSDGTFLWESERTGYNHVYRYRPDGTLVGPVTRGNWRMRRVLDVEEEDGVGTLLFEGTEGGAINSNTYRVNLDGTGFQRLTRGPGRHSVSFNADKTFLLDRVSSLESPEEVRLCDGNGDLVQVLGKGEIPAEKEGYAVGRWEVHEVAARDGMALDVTVMKPVPFDPAQRYPVWISTYSGPDAPSIRNSWNGSSWTQFLAQNGVINMQVNVRSASGKGHWATSAMYKQAGVQELQDLEDAVAWLTANDWADASRVGITGYSYGGFMSAYALLASDKFALGIAGGGVYDWGMYDTIYTERYMSTPQANPEGYAKTSCLNKAQNLKGFLHMYHGVMDDNVHFQNMMQLAFELQKAGKTSWSMMAYPQNRHGIRNGDQRWHSRQVEWDLIREHLRPVTAADREKGATEAMFDLEVGSGEGR